MSSLVFRLWVLLLAVLIQVGSWRAEASNQVGASSAPPPAAGDFDAAGDSSEELSAVDDSPGSDLLVENVSNWCTAPESSVWHPWVGDLPTGGPPTDTPFKPPRA
jgi:hypothetical protein